MQLSFENLEVCSFRVDTATHTIECVQRSHAMSCSCVHMNTAMFPHITQFVTAIKMQNDRKLRLHRNERHVREVDCRKFE